ncbi:NACHT domain-containing protein [Streptomyces sp. NRRL F-5053]|uniref:NACHT domain-containing protein n=1 Tax=Streptomyces sp. NRRL F-5053 TaxID=1463854 RepID=UPI0004CC288D|nr:NACHT domain-containing protein [Streptomyces sp. NRRL F-5053]
MVGLGARRHRRIWACLALLGVGLFVVCLFFTVWHAVHGTFSPSDTATLAGPPLAALSLIAGVVAIRKPIEGDDAELARSRAKTLARQVMDSESKVLRQLLGADHKSIDLAYVLHPASHRAATAPPAGRTHSSAVSASLPDVLQYYRGIRPRRLVITGAAGAGKTVLALELMLALLEEREEDHPVPVRISLAEWDACRPLTELLTRRLFDAYDWPRAPAVGLVDQGLILPVLDGLDEMDPGGGDGGPAPAAPRARAAVEALNAYQDGRDAGPLILTCRTDHYDALGPGDQLIDAARITIAPVDTGEAIRYLTDRARDVGRWRPLIQHLTADPTGPLAALLSTPWRLCLTATIYHRTGNPDDLSRHPTAYDLDRHLLARYIPAVTANVHNPHGYEAAQVHRWLHHLTRHLTGPGTHAPADLALHKLWPLAGRFRVRLVDALLGLLFVCCLPLPFALHYETYGSFARIDEQLLAIVGVFVLFDSVVQRSLIRFRPPPLTRRQVGICALLVCGGAVVMDVIARFPEVWTRVGAPPGTTPWHEGRLFFWAVGGVLGFLIWFGVQWRSEPSRVASPWILMRDDLIGGVLVGCPLGLSVGISGVVVYLFADPSASFLQVLSTLALACIWASPQGARRYGVLLLCSRGRLPFRLAGFLDWAVTAGLLRYSGPAYQFRHRELQQWLSNHPHP